MFQKRLPAEWEKQDAILIAFPSKQSDWSAYWEDIIPCYVNIIQVISSYQPLIVLSDDVRLTKSYLNDIDLSNVYFIELPINDTWARDFGAITIETNSGFEIQDFMFNGWGLKFAADKDNLITAQLWNKGLFRADNKFIPDLVLEGGSIESDGKGTLLTTSNCLLSPNRNPHFSRQQIEEKLKDYFGLKRILWLEHGHLEGDDTDAHIDTLARLCDEQTIAYVQCTNEHDSHFDALKKMEDELKQFKTSDGLSYTLIPLPMCSPVYAPDDHRRLPATYANFLIMNDVVLMPTYNLPDDNPALQQLRLAFPDKKVESVDCTALLLQHGSLHCITMQFPMGSINFDSLNKHT